MASATPDLGLPALLQSITVHNSNNLTYRGAQGNEQTQSYYAVLPRPRVETVTS